ncbi:Sialidase [Pleurostoma richardsiae]|uniref:Sialidase n=1 Tax=Pleurostoma richardsiae TaxID=41990 RepID=A0AA38S811_9PEZI|nr:Sialidase [Pleurostoma richardsiae]
MSTLAADVSFDFSYPQCDPVTPPSFTFDPSLLDIPYHPGHARSSSHGSAYSIDSSPSDSVSTRRTTPSRSPIRTHGPLLLPKIRSQDQAITAPAASCGSPPKRQRTSPAPSTVNRNAFRPAHNRSFTNPETISFSPPVSFSPQLSDDSNTPTLLCSPVNFAPSQDFPPSQSRRASSCSLDNVAIEKYGFPTYRQMPAYVAAQAATTAAPTSQLQACFSQPEAFMFQPQLYAPRAPSPLAAAPALTPEPEPTTTLLAHLTAPNPAPSLVHTISFPLRDPHTKHFWWDVRQVRQWSAFNTSAILSLPGAASLLYCPVPSSLIPTPVATQRHPETESALHSIYASYYLPKLNSALAASSSRPLQLSVPSRSSSSLPSSSPSDCMFVANVTGEPSTAAAIFGGKPTARVVGLVKSFDRFNTGMRVEGNVKRVEYLRGLAHLHHAMREHSCRYGFILTEIELVVVRNGAEGTPHFGYLEVGVVQLNASGTGEQGAASQGESSTSAAGELPMTACLALWGLCMMASDETGATGQGHAHWRAEIGAPAEGTRRKALPRDDWMPQPQLAEKREAKRARGWVWPEDPIGRKELGKRGVRYGAC